MNMPDAEYVGDIRYIRKLVGNISVGELFNDEFMHEYTHLCCFHRFSASLGKILRTLEDIPLLSGRATDALVWQYTEFGSWPEMVFTACDYYLVKHMQ